MDYRDVMSDPSTIWRLGEWIAGRSSGVVRLTWSTATAELETSRGRVVSIRGLDVAELSRRLGVAPAGRDELLSEVRELAQHSRLDEAQIVGAAKAMLLEALDTWLRDPGRGLALAETSVEPGEPPTISLAHVLVELVLASEDDTPTHMILPHRDVLLRRAPRFLELYSPLRLSEEADLIVAKITGQRTAAEIAGRSPHGSQDVLRLLAALAATGMLEVVPHDAAAAEHEPLPRVRVADAPPRRRLRLGWILAAAVGLMIVLALATAFLLRPDAATPTATGSRTWTVAVDMGCEPADLQRILKKASQFPNDLQAVRTDLEDGEPCWRLVWGQFTNEQDALAAEGDVPSRYVRDGFTPHPVELPVGSTPPPAEP